MEDESKTECRERNPNLLANLNGYQRGYREGTKLIYIKKQKTYIAVEYEPKTERREHNPTLLDGGKQRGRDVVFKEHKVHDIARDVAADGNDKQGRENELPLGRQSGGQGP
jgi:hypothetical protein